MNINIVEVDFVSTTCVNMCQVKPLESFKGGYHPIIPHHNHFNSMFACKVNHYKILANQAWHKKLWSLVVIANMFIHNRLNQERWTNHIYKNKRGRVHTSFSHLSLSIIYRHNCLSLARLNDVKTIRVHVHWTKLESVSIQ